MFKKILTGLTAVALASSFVTSVSAQTSTIAYVTSITYQNLTSSNANLTLTFYAEGASTATTTYNTTLVGNAAGALYVGNISQINAGFKGSTVMASDQPVAATLVQVPPGSNPSKVRPLSNGFSGGSATVLLGTALRNAFGTQTSHIIAVQNTDSVANDVTITFYATGSTVPTDSDTVTNLPAGASTYFDLGQDTELGTTFNGSAVVTALKNGSSNPGSIVATALELNAATGNTAASAFEGFAAGATTVYMPSALCNFGSGLQNSFYAVQNTSNSQTATVSVTYSPGGFTQNATIGPYGKSSFVTCSASGITNPGYNGAATITSNQPIIVIGKVSGQGLSTAFLGTSTGFTKVALPYVRWASDANYIPTTGKQRTFITIQNIGATTIPTGTITVKYYDPAGGISSTHTINVQLLPGAKTPSNPNSVANSGTYEFGYLTGNTGGSAVIEGPAGSQLNVVARVASMVNNAVSPNVLAGEDYNGIAAP